MQLLMEVHYCGKSGSDGPLDCWAVHSDPMETALDWIRFQSHLLGHGYVVVNKNDNPFCKLPHCHLMDPVEHGVSLLVVNHLGWYTKQ